MRYNDAIANDGILIDTYKGFTFFLIVKYDVAVRNDFICV